MLAASVASLLAGAIVIRSVTALGARFEEDWQSALQRICQSPPPRFPEVSASALPLGITATALFLAAVVLAGLAKRWLPDARWRGWVVGLIVVAGLVGAVFSGLAGILGTLSDLNDRAASCL
ncbi:hypothetical protein [Actinoplanes sp. HUAS TT8]|uniref:hypothetical protein n=1 Tax=Actinoplanes sp. HUAS TT8 TaxID=3447453 RepID=UPI003F524724